MALEIVNNYYGEDNFLYASILQNFCGILEILGEYVKAKKGY
jgi:hypothetical protein